jgi:hypothetical protein
MSDIGDIGAFLKQRVGPLPVWSYALLSFGIAWWYLSRRKSKSSGTETGSPPTGQFSSTQSTKYTDPKTGQQIDTSYTAQGAGYGGALGPWYAQPMPYSGGDVYVNYPGQPTAPAPSPTPPSTPTLPRNPDWGHWVTVRPGDTVASLTQAYLGDANLWTKVWTDPVNKILHDARAADPGNVQPGDVLWIFDGWKPGWVAPPDFVPYPLVKAPPPEDNPGGGQWQLNPSTGQPSWLAAGSDGSSQQTVQLTPTQNSPRAA